MRLNLTSKVDRQPSDYGMGRHSAADRYEQLSGSRSPFLQRARDCAKVTLPGLIPDDNYGEHGSFKTPYQSLGARGINYLASRLLITLFPPNSAFFKLEVDSLALRVEEAGPEIKTELDTALVKVEHAVMQVMEVANGRASMHEAFKHLLVGGNALLYVSDEGIRVIHLDRYVLCRDPMGHVTEIVVKEEVYPEALPAGFYDEDEGDEDDEYSDEPSKKTLAIYTCVKFYNGECHWYQECKGKEIPGTHGKSSEENSPWIHFASIASTPKSTVAATPSSTTATCWRWSRCIRQS